jgi:competence protein ComEC
LWLQGLLTLGLAPFLIWAFHSLPLYSFIANLIAVPFISFIGLPLLFLSALIGMISIEWGQFMIHWLDELWVLFGSIYSG